MSSVRERAEAAASRAAEDKIVKLDPRLHGGMSHAVQYVGSVRQRLAKEEFEQEAKAPRGERSAAIDYYYDLYKEQQAKKRAEEAEQRRKEQARIEQQRAQQAERLKEKLLAICYWDMGATDDERSHVETLIRQNHPERFGDPDIHKFTLMKLRNALGQ
jgi:hypothetical protein